MRTIVEVDMLQMGVRRDPATLQRLLASLGRGTGTDLSTQAIANDIAGAERSVQRDTVAGYLDILSRLMITEDVPAWAPHMRSTTPLRKSPTRFMIDPSLGFAALGTGPEQLLRDLNATGFHFEGMVVRDLRIYAQPIGGQLSHWRGAASLLRFKDKVDTAKTGEPAFLAVVTTRGAGLRRGDGVQVLPIASLGP